MDIRINIKNERSARKLLADLRSGAPGAVALACNKLADGVQAEVRKGLPSAFTLRRKPFIEQSIYRNKSTDFARYNQRPIQATVRINPERDYLAKHEDGGLKTPRSGQFVAIPLKPVRPVFSQVVRDKWRIGTLKTDPNVRKLTTPAGTFLVRDVKGRGKANRGARTDFLYVFRRSVPLKPRLRMLETFSRVVDKDAVPQMMRAIDAAISKALG